jgi:hypothetical protein
MKRRSPLWSDSPQQILDYLEIRALWDPDATGSASELLADLTITGSDDAMEGANDAVSYTEGVIDAVFSEAEKRIQACGENNYPFELQHNVLTCRDSRYSQVYSFLLLLSVYGEKAVAGVNAAKLFEDVCARAIAIYLGCSKNPASTYVFGFPRRIGAKHFPKAVHELCTIRLLEGEPDSAFPNVSAKKDAGLDIVAWLPFPDRKRSKIIVFAQCATGELWWGKRNELQPSSWCNKWLTKHPSVLPLKMFLVPHSISDNEWAELAYDAGVVFDRFRITHFAEQGISKDLRNEIKEWCKAVRKTAAK